jgi:dipeptidase E
LGDIVRLYLSSFKIGTATEELKALLAKTNKKLAYISNALDWSRDFERRQKGEQSDLKQLEALGARLGIESIDLREYFNKQDKLKARISEFGAMWVCGGNAFVLRQAMKLSGLDGILREFSTKHANVLYGGYSAGVCILGPTLRGVHLMDHPTEKPYGDYDTVWDGLGILSYVVVPHFESDHPDSDAAGKAVAYLRENDIPFRTLRDGEVIVIDD